MNAPFMFKWHPLTRDEDSSQISIKSYCILLYVKLVHLNSTHLSPYYWPLLLVYQIHIQINGWLWIQHLYNDTSNLWMMLHSRFQSETNVISVSTTYTKMFVQALNIQRFMLFYVRSKKEVNSVSVSLCRASITFHRRHWKAKCRSFCWATLLESLS